MSDKFQYGGMAVIEGVMMRGRHHTALAVRKPDGSIVVEQEPNSRTAIKYPFLKWPLIRGSYVLIESMVVGIRMLNKSANMNLDETDEELSLGEIAITVALAFGLAIGLFLILPTGLVHFASAYLGGIVMQNIVEGIIRIVFFLLYVYFISRLEDIDRVFRYHGAEHKTIFAFEAGEELEVENVKKYSTLHPRCGTSFLLIVMVISIFVFALLGSGDLFYRIWSRLVVFPVIAGLGYEFIKLSGKYYHMPWAKALIMPGLYLQKLTTREPDDGQIEVAITALRTVLPLEDNAEEEAVSASPSLEGDLLGAH